MKRGYQGLVFIFLALNVVFESSGILRGPLSKIKHGNDEWASLNFEFCTMLSNAKFDTNMYINALGGTIDEVRLPASFFVKLIDTAAKNYHEYLNTKDKDLDYESSRRYACYSAVSGTTLESTGVSNGFCNLQVLILVLKAIDPVTYFPFLSIKHITHRSINSKPIADNWRNVQIVPDESNPLGVKIREDGKFKSLGNPLELTRERSDPSLKRYKIAYLIMVHKNLDCLVSMMQALYSTDAVYLIHVDKNYPDFPKQVITWMENSNAGKNVFIMNRSFYGQWGGSSLVFIELEGFFQLMDLAEWDYVINLSANDYPIANSSKIHRILEKTPQKSYITRLDPDPQIFSRLTESAIVNRERTAIKINSQNPRIFPWANRYPPKRSSQWMVISQFSF